MINVAQTRAYIDATHGEIIAVPKLQLVEMLAEVEIGQHARRLITDIRSAVVSVGTTSVAA